MKKGRSKSKIKVLFIIVSIIILILLGILALGLNMRWWSFGNNFIKIDTALEINSKANEFAIGYKSHTNLICVGGLVIINNEGYLEWRNDKGELVKKSDVKMDFPIIKSNRDFLVVAEGKGDKIEVYNKQNLLWRGTIDESILNVDINQNGYVAVVRKYTGFKSAVEVYDNSGKKMFYACKASNMIINAVVLSNNRTTLLNSINSNGCALETVVECVGNDGKTINKFRLDNTIILKVQSLNDGSAVLGSSNEIFIVASDGKLKLERKFNFVQSVSAVSSDTVAIAGISSEKEETSAHVVQFLDDNNEIRNTLDVGISIKSMIAQDDSVIVNLGRKVIILNRNGLILGGTTLSSEILGIHYLSRGKALLTTSESAVICNY